MRMAAGWAVLVAVAVGCNGPDDSDSAHTHTDETEDCESGERNAFVAFRAIGVCEYFESCPADPPIFPNRGACVQHVQDVWSLYNSWSECDAADCAAWLDTAPACTDAAGPLHASCESIDKETDTR